MYDKHDEISSSIKLSLCVPIWFLVIGIQVHFFRHSVLRLMMYFKPYRVSGSLRLNYFVSVPISQLLPSRLSSMKPLQVPIKPFDSRQGPLKWSTLSEIKKQTWKYKTGFKLKKVTFQCDGNYKIEVRNVSVTSNEGKQFIKICTYPNINSNRVNVVLLSKWNTKRRFIEFNVRFSYIKRVSSKSSPQNPHLTPNVCICET